jgi:hypothetical protein
MCAMPPAQRTPDIRQNVVFFARVGCRLDLSQPLQWLQPLFDLQHESEATVLRASSSFCKIRCSSMPIKFAMLKGAVRSVISTEFCVGIDEDLLQYERAQKQAMRPVMQALFEAGFNPSWRRSTVVWKYKGQWYSIRPGELHTRVSAKRIQEIARLKCGAATLLAENQRLRELAAAQKHTLHRVISYDCSRRSKRASLARLLKAETATASVLEQRAQQRKRNTPAVSVASHSTAAPVLAAAHAVERVTEPLVECSLGQAVLKVPASVAAPLKAAWDEAYQHAVQQIAPELMGVDDKVAAWQQQVAEWQHKIDSITDVNRALVAECRRLRALIADS